MRNKKNTNPCKTFHTVKPIMMNCLVPVIWRGDPRELIKPNISKYIKMSRDVFKHATYTSR